MGWRVVWTAPAARDLRRLDRDVARRVREGVLCLASTGQGDVRQLRGQGQAWRLGRGDWRVAFAYDVGEGTITALSVRHRCEA